MRSAGSVTSGFPETCENRRGVRIGDTESVNVPLIIRSTLVFEHRQIKQGHTQTDCLPFYIYALIRNVFRN